MQRTLFLCLWSLVVVRSDGMVQHSSRGAPERTTLQAHDAVPTFEQVISMAKQRLQEAYGDQTQAIHELDVLAASVEHNLDELPQGNITIKIPSRRDQGAVERQVANLMTVAAHKIKSLERRVLQEPWMQRFQQQDGDFEKQGGYLLRSDVPCETQEDCRKLTQLMNACSDAKRASYNIYSTYNGVTLALNQVMAVLCACIFIGPAHICALRQFPYTCVFPYQAFSTFLTGTSSVWEVVKTLSSLCRMHGDPRLIPGIA